MGGGMNKEMTTPPGVENIPVENSGSCPSNSIYKKSPDTNCSMKNEGKEKKKRSKRESKNCKHPKKFDWCEMKCEASSALDQVDYGCEQAFGNDKKTGWASNG